MWIIKQDLRLLALRLAFTARSVERWEGRGADACLGRRIGGRPN
jgi:hypothetical protein